MRAGVLSGEREKSKAGQIVGINTRPVPLGPPSVHKDTNLNERVAEPVVSEIK